MTFTRIALAAFLLSMALAARSGQRSWPIGQAPEELRSAVQRADLIVVEMQGAVLRELHDALERGGLVGAASFCHLDTIATLQRLAAREGIAAGRTSDRVRNPANAPRPWAAPIVAAHAGRTAREVEGFVVDLGDKVGLLRPIVEQTMCAACHGSPDRLDPGVMLVLRGRYPSDLAVGFRDGDIRGWFWVEMPKRAR